MMDLRDTCQHELIFEDCRIPAANRLGSVGDGLRAALDALIFGRMVVVAWCIGSAERALELGISYSFDRVQFGKPIGTFQEIRWMIIARSLLHEAGMARV